MDTLRRREFLELVGGAAVAQAALGKPASAQTAKSPTFYISMHEASSANIDFKTGAEGYAKAGIKGMEPVSANLRAFIAKESPAVAKRLASDLGLTLLSLSGAQRGLVEPRPDRPANLEGLKGFLDLAQSVGIDRIVMPSLPLDHLVLDDPSGLSTTYTADDYKRGAENLREVGEIAKPFGVTMMFEFVRATNFASTLPTALKLVRDANHPNVRNMIDTYHFWGGLSKFEDLELLRDGEIVHIHLEDVPGTPPIEALKNTDRVYPGEGIAPLRRILEVLKRKKYTGAVSVELFNPTIQSADPYQVAMKARATVEPIIAGL